MGDNKRKNLEDSILENEKIVKFIEDINKTISNKTIYDVTKNKINVTGKDKGSIGKHIEF